MVRRTRGERPTYKLAIKRVLEQVHPNMSISKQAMSIMNDFVEDSLDKIATQAADLCKLPNKKRTPKTLGARDIQTAVRLVVFGKLGQLANSKGTQAVVCTYYAERGTWSVGRGLRSGVCGTWSA